MSTDWKKIDPADSLAKLKSKRAAAPAVDEDGTERGKKDESLALIESFEPRRPRIRFTDIVLPERTRYDLDVLISRIRNHSLIYEEWELKAIDPRGLSVAVNFHGQPGTGKSMCAEALAAEMSKPLIEINYAEIESKYVGETPKNIRAAFQKAQEADAVLFFDEADSILGRRMTHVTQAADHGVNVSRAVMLKQLDTFSGIIVFATNLARNFDGAFVRRILQHIEVPAPDMDGRSKIWQRMLSKKVPGRDALDWTALAQASDGLVGGDIKNAVIISLSELASRSGPRLLQLPDVIRAIDNVKKAKKDVGRNEGLAE